MPKMPTRHSRQQPSHSLSIAAIPLMKTPSKKSSTTQSQTLDADASKAATISSPASTGGAGTFFEQNVDAYWLVQLLVGWIPPILIDCAVVEVHLQTEHLGWHTDDFLIVGQNGRGEHRKLIGQVKRSFTVSSSDEECKKTFQDFWQDFKIPERFSASSDRFVIVTQRGTNILLEHFAGLLDCARASRSGTEFEQRLNTAGFISAKAVHHCNELSTIIGELENRIVSPVDIWPFLCVLHVLSLDLHTSTRQTEAMMKGLLAYTAAEADQIGISEASWNALLAFAADSMPAGRSLSRNDLPSALRERHSAIASAQHRVLKALRDHSTLILEGIHSEIGGNTHLTRAGLIQTVIETFGESQIVLISGPAGAGKSVVAKNVLAQLSKEHFVFSFRAEEFATTHFDTTLQNNQIPANGVSVGAILASQARKVLLVESIERLLESPTRDSFKDLLSMAAADKSLYLVLTCRDYSADLVRSCFLETAHLTHSLVTVPPLDDSELSAVQAAHPTLSRPFTNPALREVLRNPYILDKALRISWSPERPLPESEREFRDLFWREVVRDDQRQFDGMPRRREEAFQQIALRRARSLTLYVACDDLDASVLNLLQADALVISPKQNSILMAPAHDILEDWAILHWTDEQFSLVNGSLGELIDRIGTYPAIRRSYRKWVTELVERDPNCADNVIPSVVLSSVPAHFRDDTLVSLLRTESSTNFLERHESELIANNYELLRRVLHLLRVACVTTPSWLAGQGALFTVPDGTAWPSLLRIVQRHLKAFKSEDHLLLLGFVEDWVRGISVYSEPYPDGADSVAAIAHWLVSKFDDHRSEDKLKTAVQVIAKIPNADPKKFGALLRGTDKRETRGRASEILQNIVLSGMEGTAAARDQPDLVISVATSRVLCSEADLQRTTRYVSPIELEMLFGIKESEHDYFPPSAYRGPLLPLLRYHPDAGLDFVISVFNHSADWYAHPRVPDRIEPPSEICLTFKDGTSRKQWGNSRLWNWYRGSTVGPNVLLSYLMALERWLLGYADAFPKRLDDALLNILRKSNSVALTAVVASIANAFPRLSGETLLVLLRCPECILLDRQRLASEHRSLSSISAMLPRARLENRVFEEERKQADIMAHRKNDLENAIRNLQLSQFAPQVHAILDEHNAALPPIPDQNEEHRIWRLSMHKMDLRQYVVKESSPEEPQANAVQGSTPDTPTVAIYLELKDPDPDVKEMVVESSARFASMQSKLSVWMWGEKVFNQDDSGAYNPAQWKEQLNQARTWDWSSSDDQMGDMTRGGPGIVAAVCVRDHWNEMSEDEQEWCVQTVCSEVTRQASSWNHLERVQRFDVSADRACARILPLLLGKSLPERSRKSVRDAFAVALTHPINEVRSYTVWGIATQLWSIDYRLTLRCVNALAAQGVCIQELMCVANEIPYPERRPVESIEIDAATLVRQRFWLPDSLSNDAYERLDTAEWFGAEANGHILVILAQMPTEPIAVKAFKKAAQRVADSWNDDRNGYDDNRRPRNRDMESAVSELLRSFVMRTSSEIAGEILQPILDAIDSHGREVYWVIEGLIGVEDREPNTDQFWSIWTMFADRIKNARWLGRIDDQYSSGNELMSAIFLGTFWKEDARHWRSLEGHVHHVHELFEALPPSSTVMDDYVRFLYHIGERSLPGAFIQIAKRLRHGNPRTMLSKANTVFTLALLLQRHVYSRPLELKREPILRDSILFLLDELVERGSSAAFRMRDDFVTPIPVG